MFMIALGTRRYDDNGKSLLSLFGMNGSGVSFQCDSCDAIVENRLPVRAGNYDDRWYCSLPCGWMDYQTEDNLERLFRWVSVSDPETESPIKSLVIQILVNALEVANAV